MATQNTRKGKDDSILFAIIGVALTVIGFIIALVAKRDNKYVMYYGKQGLILFFAFLISGAVSVIPFIGSILSTICGVMTIILWIIGIIYAASGEEKSIPVISNFADMLNL